MYELLKEFSINKHIDAFVENIEQHEAKEQRFIADPKLNV